MAVQGQMGSWGGELTFIGDLFCASHASDASSVLTQPVLGVMISILQPWGRADVLGPWLGIPFCPPLRPHSLRLHSTCPKS